MNKVDDNIKDLSEKLNQVYELILDFARLTTFNDLKDRKYCIENILNVIQIFKTHLENVKCLVPNSA
jgi:hypothetical protein